MDLVQIVDGMNPKHGSIKLLRDFVIHAAIKNGVQKIPF